MSQSHLVETPDLAHSAAKNPNNTQEKPNDSTKKKTAKSPATPSFKNKAMDTHSMTAADDSHPGFVGMHTLSAASKVICLCSLQISKKQPFMYINELRSHEVYRNGKKINNTKKNK
jgi:hypothetical protein